MILLTGMPGSGKEEFLKICMSKGIRVLRMGDFVRSETAAKGLDLTDENVGSIAQGKRETDGFDYWAKKTVEALDDRLTLIDGVRGRSELSLFRRMIRGGIIIVAVHSSPATRYRRLITRARSDAPTSHDEFERRDVRELRWGLGDVIARADYIIINEGDLEDLRNKVGAIIDEIIQKNKP